MYLARDEFPPSRESLIGIRTEMPYVGLSIWTIDGHVDVEVCTNVASQPSVSSGVQERSMGPLEHGEEHKRENMPHSSLQFPGRYKRGELLCVCVCCEIAL